MRRIAANAPRIVLLLAFTLALGASAVGSAQAQEGQPPETQGSPLHPLFPLLDEEGINVLESGNPVSTMKTCGSCHDADFIASHAYHSSQGLQDLSAPGELEGGRAWDTSPGLFGRWSPIGYRYLTPQGEQPLDMGTADWIRIYGARHVGGGPAEFARDGVTRLDELASVPGDPETHVLDPETDEMVPWDWTASGVVEMNCFLCHTPNPDNQARIQALQSGSFRWANTATLLATGIVTRQAEGFRWNEEAFDEQGQLRPGSLPIQDPEDANCALCHGLVQDDLEHPVTLTGCSAENLRTVTTGQIISPQRLSDTGLNIAGKETLARPWDVHADRLLKCTDCHYALNNPVYYQEQDQERPEHLLFDPRRLELGEYLYQPLHQFARGESAQNTVAPQLRNTMRRCDSCHSVEATHDWLPYKNRHMDVLSCESCHIPKMFANAMMQYDLTVLTSQGSGNVYCRGVEGDPSDAGSLVTGFEPVLLPREDVDGDVERTPFNLVTSYYWVYGDPPRPVRQIDLQAAWFEGDGYADEVLAAFDQDGDAQLSKEELRLDAPEKERLIAGRLEALGLENVRIMAEIQPYNINHTVATDEWALRECSACHGGSSRLTQPMQLTAYQPGGVTPTFVGDSSVHVESGEIVAEGGMLYFQPRTRQAGIYVFGLDAIRWVDAVGGGVFLAVLAGVSLHGGLRFYRVARARPKDPALRRIYMYGFYERLWHWLQTFTIVGLLFTGLIIHKPDVFGAFAFRQVVLTHNILAGILAANAALALFYHLASGEIRQFLPRPRGFFDQAIMQAKYYLGGIFRGEGHPFEKSPQKKLNPLQQLTYLAILNVLLPLQGLTGVLMWGVQQWPEIAERLGGLPLLASIHSLIAWLFGAFIVLHVYLTTTGATPLSSIRAMIDGWDVVEPVTEEA